MFFFDSKHSAPFSHQIIKLSVYSLHTEATSSPIHHSNQKFMYILLFNTSIQHNDIILIYNVCSNIQTLPLVVAFCCRHMYIIQLAFCFRFSSFQKQQRTSAMGNTFGMKFTRSPNKRQFIHSFG